MDYILFYMKTLTIWDDRIYDRHVSRKISLKKTPPNQPTIIHVKWWRGAGLPDSPTVPSTVNHFSFLPFL